MKYWRNFEVMKPKDGELCALANDYNHGLEDTSLGFYRKNKDEFENYEGSTFWWQYWFPLPQLPEDA